VLGVRSLLVVLGVAVGLLLLVSSGSVSAQLCVRNVGCLRADDGGFRLETARDVAGRAARATRAGG
jgi:hypothetical protein